MGKSILRLAAALLYFLRVASPLEIDTLDGGYKNMLVSISEDVSFDESIIENIKVGGSGASVDNASLASQSSKALEQRGLFATWVNSVETKFTQTQERPLSMGKCGLLLPSKEARQL